MNTYTYYSLCNESIELPFSSNIYSSNIPEQFKLKQVVWSLTARPMRPQSRAEHSNSLQGKYKFSM